MEHMSHGPIGHLGDPKSGTWRLQLITASNASQIDNASYLRRMIPERGGIGICHQYQCKTLPSRVWFACVCASISSDFGFVRKRTKRESWALHIRVCQYSTVDKVSTAGKDTHRLGPLHCCSRSLCICPWRPALSGSLHTTVWKTSPNATRRAAHSVPRGEGKWREYQVTS